MEQGFSDACTALCLNQRPVARVAQSCRAAAIEMPRPTVRKWCEHGYNEAFSVREVNQESLDYTKHPNDKNGNSAILLRGEHAHDSDNELVRRSKDREHHSELHLHSDYENY